MGLYNSPNIFQEKMSKLMVELDFVQAYLNNLLLITKGNFEKHLVQLEQALTWLSEASLKINTSKFSFCQTELEYLGYWITRNGIRPITKKVEAIQKLKVPTNMKLLWRFIGMIDYYQDIWPQRLHILAPLTALTSAKVKWNWTAEHQTAFDEMKQVMTRETLLAYPNFKEPFHIHMDASLTQLGACISQNGKPIAFYSCELNPAQAGTPQLKENYYPLLKFWKNSETFSLVNKSMYTLIMRTWRTRCSTLTGSCNGNST